MLNLRCAFTIAFAAIAILAGCANAPSSALAQQGGTYFILEVDAAALDQQDIENKVEQTAEVIRRRINPTGELDIDVTRQPDHRILIRAEGGEDLDAIRRHIGVVGQLTFNLVREHDLGDDLPADAMLAQPYPGIGDSAVAVDRSPRLIGARLAQVNPTTDPLTNEFVLAFRFDTEGARMFCQITRDHVGERFAVLLDNQVLTAPRINEAICGGSGQISGGFTAQSANDLAAVLRAGALPAPLILVEEGVYTDAD